MYSQKNKELVRKLRKQGFSYFDISHKTGIAKSTVYAWSSGEALTDSAKNRLIKKSVKGRKKGVEKNIFLKNQRIAQINNDVENVVRGMYLSKEMGQLFASLLYWGEGSKNQGAVYFTNSDPVMIGFFIRLLDDCFCIDRKKLFASLHLHSYHDRKEMLGFWSEVTGIDQGRIGVYVKQEAGVNKKKEYMGCIQIRYCDVVLYRYIKKMYTTLVDSWGLSVPSAQTSPKRLEKV